MEITQEKQSEPYSSSVEKKASVAKKPIVSSSRYCWQLLGLSNYSFSLTIPFRIKWWWWWYTVPWMEMHQERWACSILMSMIWPTGLATCVSVSWLLPDTATCRVWSGRQGFDRLCTCVAAPPWHGDLPSAVWPAGIWPPVKVCRGSSLTRRPAECGLAGRGLTTCESVSWLLPDTVTCRVQSGRQGFDRLCTCVVAPSWHSHLLSVVWPDLYVWLILCLLCSLLLYL